MKMYDLKDMKVLMITFSVVFALSIVLFEGTDVEAKNKKTEEVTKKCDSTKVGDIADRYNITAELNDSDTKLVIEVNPNVSDKTKREQLEKAVFQLKKINHWSWDATRDGETTKVSAGKKLNLSIRELEKYKLPNDNDVTLRFFADEVLVGDCLATGNFEIKAENVFGGKIRGAEVAGGDAVDIPDYSSDTEISGNIDCAHPTNDDEKEYCQLQATLSSRSVKNLGNYSSSINSSSNFVGSPINLKCDAKAINNVSTEDGTNYFSNVATMTASKTIEKDLGEAYVYRFAPGNTFSDTNPLQCKIKCTEDVVVEYGPPVATKAGLCIEYEIRATSHLKCQATTLPKKPQQYKGYCDPRPRCVHKNGKTGDRAGPDEDFDDCIKKCDGGKYTEKCSKKCYDKVYKNNEKLSFDSAPSVQKMASTSEIKECKEISKKYGRFYLNEYNGSKPKDGFYGCYYWDGNKIYWSGDGNDTPARFYPDEDPNRNYSNYTVAAGDGFIRRVTNGNVCGAKCHYSTSTCDQYKTGNRTRRLKSEYLNPGVAHEDNKINKATYERAVKACKSAVVEKVRTATFIVKVDGKEIYTADKLTNNEGTDYNNKINNSNYINSFNGLYKNGSLKKAWYQTKWAALTSWINTKSGELTYKDPCENNTTCGYIKREHKYCLPLNQQDVNTKWWNYYYTKLYGDEPSISVNGKAFEDECVTKNTSSSSTSSACQWKVNNLTTEDENAIRWNISGGTTEFGFFGWKINVSCFYAINSNICSANGTGSPTTTSGDTSNKCGGDGKKIRTVDLQQLFPSEDGSAKASRNPGFNWTTYAYNEKTTSAKSVGTYSTNFDSYPSKYAEWIQSRSYSIYSDRYLDYDIYLSKEMINRIRNENINYSDFKAAGRGKTTVNDVTTYESNLIRETIGDANADYPKGAALRCNNIKNHASQACEDFK